MRADVSLPLPASRGEGRGEGLSLLLSLLPLVGRASSPSLHLLHLGGMGFQPVSSPSPFPIPQRGPSGSEGFLDPARCLGCLGSPSRALPLSKARCSVPLHWIMLLNSTRHRACEASDSHQSTPACRHLPPSRPRLVNAHEFSRKPNQPADSAGSPRTFPGTACRPEGTATPAVSGVMPSRFRCSCQARTCTSQKCSNECSRL